jgi:hypothetical protein
MQCFAFATMSVWVDPETGVLKAPPTIEQGQAASQQSSADEPEKGQ